MRKQTEERIGAKGTIHVEPPKQEGKPNGTGGRKANDTYTDYGADRRPDGGGADTEKPVFELTNWNPWALRGGSPFPLEALPDMMHRFVRDRSEITGTDPSAYAMASLVVVSAALDHRTVLQPKINDPHYLVHPVLWAMLVGDPSTRKSAPISDAVKMLQRFDTHDAKRRAERVRMLVDSGTDEKDAEKQIPAARRRVMFDITSEKLCEVLSRQNCGIGLFRDELSGWIGAMDKYGGGGRGSSQDRSVWIAAFSSSPYTQERKAETRRVEMLSVSMLGAIQPDRLAEMGKLESDGLLQRFLPVMMSRARPDKDELIDPKAWGDLSESLSLLLPPSTFRLSPEARDLYLEFSHRMGVSSALTDPSPAFGSFIGKQARTLAAITLILHAIDVAEGRCKPVDYVSDATTRRGLRIVEEFVIPHAMLFYSGIDREATRQLHGLAAGLIKCAGRKITPRDLHRKCRAARGMTLQDLQKALLLFQLNGWVVADDPGPLNKHWFVNPELAGRFDAELAEHARMHDAIVAKSKRASQ